MSPGMLTAELTAGVRVAFTDRRHGNMSSAGGEGSETGAASRERLRRQIGVRSLARVFQLHGTVVRLAQDGSTERLSQTELPRADGQLSTVSGLGLIVLSADCLPIALGREGAVAMIHAGWRGLAAGILEHAVERLDELGRGGPPRETVAVIGPGAGACCYEVGCEVHEAFGGSRCRVANIDLRAIARERLSAAGVERVQELGGCTICGERYFSHRREGAAAGRMAGVAWLS